MSRKILRGRRGRHHHGYRHHRPGRIRNLYFSNIHSFAVHAPTIIGRKDCPVENIYFNNCHFIQKERNEFDPNEPGLKNDREHTCTPCFRHVKNPVMQNTVISTL
ncbi:MAG: hypothetical protein IJP04_05320 [Clostridia bacterium]|nr:hypothetical protein [Clostridia bacterium]